MLKITELDCVCPELQKRVPTRYFSCRKWRFIEPKFRPRAFRTSIRDARIASGVRDVVLGQPFTHTPNKTRLRIVWSPFVPDDIRLRLQPAIDLSRRAVDHHERAMSLPSSPGPAREPFFSNVRLAVRPRIIKQDCQIKRACWQAREHITLQMRRQDVQDARRAVEGVRLHSQFASRIAPNYEGVRFVRCRIGFANKWNIGSSEERQRLADLLGKAFIYCIFAPAILMALEKDTSREENEKSV